MNRTGALIALAIAVTVGVVFAVFPQLDLMLSSLFYDAGHRLWLEWQLPGVRLRSVASWLITLVAAPAGIALALKLVLPRRPLIVPGRAIVLMLATLLLAPGVLANVILKDNWGRPRPGQVQEFGATERFTPWWDPRGPCPKNCSFVAGEPSGAFWTMAAAAVVPPPWRAAGYAAALAFGFAVGALRMSAGGHFFTDVVFAGLLTFFVIWTAHGLLYRWRRTRVSDAGVERVLERIAAPGYDAVTWIARRIRGR